MATLVKHDEDDAVGALYRPLLETYLNGVYALFGGDEAAIALHRALQAQVHRIDNALGITDSSTRPDDAVDLPISQRKQGDGLVERVDMLLSRLDNSYAGWAPRTHDRHYRITSLYDTHGGIGCLHKYRELTDNGSTVINPRRGDSEMPVYLLDSAIALVLGFAGLWGMKVGEDISPLVEILRRWETARAQSGIALS